MTAPTAGRDTVVIEESVHSTYKQLTEGSDPMAAPFPTMKDVFMWAASVGFNSGVRRPIEGKRITIFRWAQFSTPIDLPVLKAIAIAETESVEVLLNQDDMLRIAEEYANAGIHELSTKVLQEAGQPLWNLVEIVVL